MLETLAENRDLQPNIKEAEQMLTQVDVTKFASYGWGMRDGLERGRQEGIEQGIERGIEQGIEQGIERGIREGELKKAQAVARSLLQLGVLAEAEIARIAGLPLEEIEKLRMQH